MQLSKQEYYTHIREHVNILDVCRVMGIPERESGSTHKCKCPHHADDHPSLTIYQNTNSYYCFQCGDAGDVFRFIMGNEKCGFHDALTWIEKSFPEVLEYKPDWTSIETLNNGYDVAWAVYQQMSDEEKKLFAQFSYSRVYSPAQLLNCELVYSKGRKLSGKFSQGDEFIEERYLLEEKGLLTKVARDVVNKIALTDKYYIDYFKKDRVLIPLRNISGKIIGFAGRSASENDRPKYLFTKGLKKGEFLYHLYNIAHSAKKDVPIKLYLVEGIFDALRLRAKKQNAAAVLGSHLTEKQTRILEECVENGNMQISAIHIFMDSDEAGLNGSFKTLRNLMRSSVLRKCHISIMVLNDGSKDPDEFYKDHSIADKDGIREYSAYEYLFRYLLKNDENSLTELDVEREFQKRSSEERVQILNQIQDMLPYEGWKEVFARSHALGETDGKEAVLRERIEKYTFSNSFGRSTGYVEPVEYTYHMQNALQIVKTSYDREDITLDDWTWERIAASADVFFPYLYESFRRKEQGLKQPLIRLMAPKKLDKQRPKSMYIHEQLLSQQYVLNELLSSGCDIKYEQYIPAVRYSAARKSYITGIDYHQYFEKPVSFAYQVDMDVINGSRPATVGMFRDYYDCWKDYIHYIQDGVSRLESEVVYRVKLDIAGFYDHISKSLVRDVLQQQLTEALRVDNQKFKCFQDTEKELQISETAGNVADWILEQLFEECYLRADTGKRDRKKNSAVGIPQGSNISAYIANIVLFPLDKKVQEKVDQINGRKGEGEHSIKVRYCRYVDDMVIVSSSSESLLQVKDIIESMLYDMGFELSEKTDQAEGISKNEALQWTEDERGGLGVSVGFDFPDDSMDSVLDEYIGMERTDRKVLLNLLHSMSNMASYEELFGGEIVFHDLLKIVFQTEEIRLNDIVRFSKVMLCEAAKKEDIYSAFCNLWKQGMQDCVSDSLLYTEGLECYVFLHGCEQVLKNLKKLKMGDGDEAWLKTKDKIKEFFNKESNRADLLKTIKKTAMLKENENMMKHQLSKIDFLIEKEVGEGFVQEDFFIRWNWCQKRASAKSIESDHPQNYIQWFHWMIIRLGVSENRKEISNIFSIVRNNLILKLDPGDMNYMTNCMKIWSGGREKRQDYEENVLYASLYVLLNILRPELRAETIQEIGVYRNILFDPSQHVLSVFPGLNVPGILALENKKGSRYVAGAKRCDLYKSESDVLAGEIIDMSSEWELIEPKEVHISNANITYYKRNFESDSHFIPLGDFVRSKELNALKDRSSGESRPEDVLRVICMLYQHLYQAIHKMSEKYPNKRMIFSQENVILVLADDHKTVKDVELGITYLVNKDTVTSAVAVRQDDGSYVLRSVHEAGAACWIAGRLLEDACGVDRILLASNQSEDIHDATDIEMLQYVNKRLTNSYKRGGSKVYKSDLSYRKGVERVIRNLAEYLKQDAGRILYMEDGKIINAFIAHRMSRLVAPDNWSLAVWAKNYLCAHFDGLGKILDYVGDENKSYSRNILLKRRVSLWYLALADHIYQLYERNNGMMGIRIFALSLLSDTVLMNLRMQVLEYVQSLDSQARERYKKEYDELPMACIGLEENTEIVIGNKSWKKIWENVLGEKQDNDIKYLTHLGWIIFMTMLIEVDKEKPLLSGLSMSSWDSAVTALRGIAALLAPAEKDMDVKNKDEDEFPFESMQNFWIMWDPVKIEKMLDYMNQLDQALSLEVMSVETEFFSTKTSKREISVRLETESYCKPQNFVTYSKKGGDALNCFEKTIDDKKVRMTCTQKNGKILGISLIAKEFGDRLQFWDRNRAANVQLYQEEEIESIADQLITPEDGEKPVASLIQVSESQEEGKIPDFNAKVAGVEERLDQDKNSLVSKCFELHQKNWKKRKKRFCDYDRMALFQFRIDSSYLPPEMETRDNNKEKKETEPQMKDGYLPSYAEYRRRELLKPVFDACDAFDVEILLLPEYSIRPETVEWMCEYLEEKQYKFSIWAGTFKIPVQYKFESRYWREPKAEVLNKDIYWHSASLPIIMNDLGHGERRNICIISCKFKKYPAVALKEDLNVMPAVEAKKESFRPIVDMVRDLEGIKVSADARKDVTELICAETFVVSNAANYPSFLVQSMEEYYRYKKDKYHEDKIKEAIQRFEGYIANDIMQYGKSTAIHSLDKERTYRSSIILIPAYSSRAVDYYVIGQANYLAAGLKMVLCNAVDEFSKGGSCFIGQNSWDDNKRRCEKSEEEQRKRDILMENTYYHGLQPGIYQQTSENKDRGALGSEEQALLICDVLPNENGHPTSESSTSSLSVVAHIPILETTSQQDGAKTREELAKLLDHCNCDFCSTIQENDAKTAKETLGALGRICHSDWLIRRGEYYEQYHKIKPQNWPSPALIDWLYVDIVEREKFYENKELMIKNMIQVPK